MTTFRTPTRFDALDGWRGFAALGVAVYHAGLDWSGLNSRLVTELWTFVDFFFILSGFVITHAYGTRLVDRRSSSRFLFRRFARVWPLHAATLGVFVLYECSRWVSGTDATGRGFFTGDRSVADLLENIFLVQALNGYDPSWNFPSWSISVEFWTYGLAALLFVFTRGRTRTLALSATVIASLAFMLAEGSLEGSHVWVRCILGFSLGSLAYELFERRGEWVARTARLEVPATATLFAAIVLISDSGRLALLIPLVFTVTLVVFTSGTGVVSGILNSSPMQKLGLWSYSIYLTHALIYLFFVVGYRRAADRFDLEPLLSTIRSGQPIEVVDLGSVWLNNALLVVLVVGVVGVSALTYRFVEVPAKDRLTGLLPDRRESPASNPH